MRALNMNWVLNLNVIHLAKTFIHHFDPVNRALGWTSSLVMFDACYMVNSVLGAWQGTAGYTILCKLVTFEERTVFTIRNLGCDVTTINHNLTVVELFTGLFT
ncbi:hypothetical protein D3C81_1477000 [compost metagenome]